MKQQRAKNRKKRQIDSRITSACLKLDRGGLARLPDDTDCVLGHGGTNVWQKRAWSGNKAAFWVMGRCWGRASSWNPHRHMAEPAKSLPAYSVAVVATLWGYVRAQPDMHHGENSRGVFFILFFLFNRTYFPHWHLSLMNRRHNLNVAYEISVNFPSHNMEETLLYLHLKVRFARRKSQTTKLRLIIEPSAGADLWGGSISLFLEEMMWMASSCVLCVLQRYRVFEVLTVTLSLWAEQGKEACCTIG